MKNKYMEMIHAAFDGELSPSERTELDTWLAGNEEARGYQESLTKLDELLHQVEQPAPPGHLRQAIVDDIPVIPTPGTRSVRGGRRWSMPAFALAATITLVALAVLVKNHSEMNELGQLSGTMVQQPRAEHRTIQVPGLAAGLSLEWKQASLVVSINLESDARVTTILEFPANQFTMEPAAHGSVGRGRLELESVGPVEFSASLQRLEGGSATEDYPIHVTFTRDGRIISTADLEVPPRG